jgi:hypothetical protein
VSFVKLDVLCNNFGVKRELTGPWLNNEWWANETKIISSCLALDAPRFCILGGNPAGWIEFEEGIEIDDILTLQEKGHRVFVDVVSDWTLRGKFGRGQIILWDAQNRTMCAGSDPRGDGHAVVWA